MKKRGVLYLTVFMSLLWIGVLLMGVIPVFGTITSDLGKAIYIVAEIVSLFFLILTIWIIARKQIDTGNAIIILVSTLMLQFLPLIDRILVGDSDSQYQALILTIVVLVIFLFVYFAFDLLNHKIRKTMPKIQGNTIEVVDESEFNDKDGKFLGANKQKEEK